ncbi:MAG: ATP phosphoribosyltransferase [Cyclobacteriaceae bacterium]|nr:ATP phosphoribosyltransferase [Cyclobacteriaceae bacterium]MCH8515390.1 ATP phosphoribosyltransferase [Cyclobacteriaceae bacterium]
MDNVIRLALQKSGRLSDDSRKLIKECGIKFNNGMGKLKSSATNFPIEFLFLRDDDIPGYVADGVADIGIVGENVLLEAKPDVELSKRLGFSKCRLSLAIPKEKEYSDASYFEGKRVATSYPEILKDYFKSKGVNASIHEISGSVEIAPGIGLADGVCDIVSSGSTLFTNGLKEVEEVIKSEAVMIANKGLSAEKRKLLEQILFRIDTVLSARNYKYILLNAPNESIEEIKAYLPGVNSPTVMPLAKEGWSSLHSVIQEDRFWEVIEKIKAAGAEGVLVLPIEKMIQ